MSVLLNGLEIPDCCDDCLLSYKTYTHDGLYSREPYCVCSITGEGRLCDYDYNRAAQCPLKDDGDYIELLKRELDRYYHSSLIISEIIVDYTNEHISAEDALDKIRINIYSSRRSKWRD